ncbi:hippurate hydrolase [Myxococcus fulvus]|uniref:Hippurate hydrolase n=1 Tax=Myxococcus fulvus TaxID=33 RepID=A0A511TG21_MYXFU|nr:amidohydrolase [Myxococcus fulvus]GEN12613.1 peptidase [Myxococcus fulvus]SET84157.1 hippurate hydrolase [Myxococcus fulvus]
MEVTETLQRHEPAHAWRPHLTSAHEQLAPRLEAFYRDLHAHPELSMQEQQTAAKVAKWLEGSGFEVTTGVGRHGVVGMLRNGPGPTVLLRADMDGLPVEEKTGRPDASRVTAKDSQGDTVPVMHACGHDVHLTCLVGVAELLASSRNHWRGTLMMVAQPAEETLQGARAMMSDGLYARFGTPSVALAQHVGPLPVGLVGHHRGASMMASASVRVRIHGKGGHGSQPHATVDPVVIAAYLVTRLQTIVSREVDLSRGGAVVSVGSLHAGHRANVIPDEAVLELTVRTPTDALQDQLIDAISRMARAECEAGRAPRPPDIEVMSRTRVMVNDDTYYHRVRAAHAAWFGEDRLVDMGMASGSEDFPYFDGRTSNDESKAEVPLVYWFFGGTSHDAWKRAPGRTLWEKLQSLPSNHSPHFDPSLDCLRFGCESMLLAALACLDEEPKAEQEPAPRAGKRLH